MPKFTISAISWLQTVLQERFGHAFALHPHTDGLRIDLRLPGDARCITLTLDSATFTRTDSDLPCAHWDALAEGYATPFDVILPAPGAEQLPSPLISATDSGWQIGYDILGLTYWMLNRIEEISRTDLDNHGRFPATASHAYKHNYLERPVVDEWLHVLGQVIRKTWPEIELKQHTFSMKVSHDVDAPSRYGFASAKGLLRAMAGDVLKRGDFKNAIRAPWIRLSSQKKIHPSDPYSTFEWIMDLSDQHGLTSAFYFICGRTSNLDADYEPEHPAMRALMRRIHERGHEIGLHPSYNTYQNPQMIAAEARRLRKIAAEEGIEQAQWGGRMHYLRWEQPTTLRAWADAGMDYDSSLGYADRPGFRCGTCFEYPAFDPVKNEELKLRVRPLVVMECSVIDACYSGLGVGEAAQAKFKSLKEVCRAVRGCFTLLWHNSSLNNHKYNMIYASVLSDWSV
ncbi:polysaccharide deacetylase family protein [Stutzerimonas nitrititolerans]|uniref:polysaccharide deacetylase family protein n=1 Tax=Stutzerimonas nitrititolerans TaxID=2482751 RepID=UPI0014837FA6|nr:polysaccharide deacetylase family protein [Stutzerimonas nitrititolerans]NNT94904.1 hypothetical protein [Stutzerimonas nitrititolerans]